MKLIGQILNVKRIPNGLAGYGESAAVKVGHGPRSVFRAVFSLIVLCPVISACASSIVSPIESTLQPSATSGRCGFGGCGQSIPVRLTAEALAAEKRCGDGVCEPSETEAGCPKDCQSSALSQADLDVGMNDEEYPTLAAQKIDLCFIDPRLHWTVIVKMAHANALWTLESSSSTP